MLPYHQADQEDVSLMSIVNKHRRRDISRLQNSPNSVTSTTYSNWSLLEIRGSNWTDQRSISDNNNSFSQDDSTEFINRSRMYLCLLVFIGSFVLLTFVLYVIFKIIKVLKSLRNPGPHGPQTPDGDEIYIPRNVQHSGTRIQVQPPPPYVEEPPPPSYEIAISKFQFQNELISSYNNIKLKSLVKRNISSNEIHDHIKADDTSEVLNAAAPDDEEVSISAVHNRAYVNSEEESGANSINTEPKFVSGSRGRKVRSLVGVGAKTL